MIVFAAGGPRRVAALFTGCLLVGSAAAIELTPLEAAGKRLYREGIGSSGRSMSARVGAQEVLVPGSAVPCASCHGLDGMGRPEGALRPPEITWHELAKPYGHRHDSGREHPPFDNVTLLRALNEGLDPASQRLDPGMPRYALDRSEVDALAAYLRRIAEDHDPGLAPATLRLGTVLPKAGPLIEAGHLVEKVLQGVFDQVNEAGGIHGRKLELVVIDAAAEGVLRTRVAAADVFALISPLAPGLSRELAAISESAGVPMVGGLGVDADENSHYSFQLAAGEREQGRVLAEFAALHLGLDKPKVVLVMPDSDRILGAAIEAQLARHGWLDVSRTGLGQQLPAAVTDWRERGVEVVFFFGGRDDFVILQQAAATAGWQPAFLSTAAHAATTGKGRVYLAAPVLPGDGTAIGHRTLEKLRLRQGLPPRQQALQIAAYTAATVMVEGLKRSGRAASRVRLVDALESLYAYETGVMPPLSFGPGRRVGVMGAHVMVVDMDTGSLRPAGGFIQLK